MRAPRRDPEGRPAGHPLQNRVTPFGELIATPARGTLMGNRGRLHDRVRRVRRRVVKSYRAWVTCLLEFRGRHRVIMAPDRYTELFFLDEATALAAGHRPCGECRRADYRRFKALWLAANRDRGLGTDAPIGAIDRELHRDRLGPEGRARTYNNARLDSLPDGVFVVMPDSAEPLLYWRDRLARWSPEGYERSRPAPRNQRVTVLTPRSTIRTIAAGYVPAIHPSFGG